MNFDFSAEQYALRDTLASLLADICSPTAAVAAGTDQAQADTIWNGLADFGLFGMLVPEVNDGLGLGFVDAALLVEELGAALVPPAVFDTLLLTDLIARYGSEAQKARLLPELAAGSLRGAIAAAETHGFGAASQRTRASRTEQGWTIEGSKILVADADRAGVLLLAATLADGTAGLFLVEGENAGFLRRQHETLDLSARYHALDLRDVQVPAESLLGAVAPGACANRLWDGAATIASLQMTGIAGRMFNTAVAYAKTREQFGKPIGSFQAIKHRCADMAVQLDSARTAAYFAAWALAEAGDEQSRAASIAKSFCGDAARFVCNESIQVHGGMGFTWELGLHFPLRRAKLLEYAWGDGSHHREQVLASALKAQTANGHRSCSRADPVG